MTSREQLLAVREIELAEMSETSLATRARHIKVLGVPPDLLRIVRSGDGMSVQEILARFYLPNVIGYAYLLRGISSGALTRDGDGRICAVEQRSPLPLARPNEEIAALRAELLEHPARPPFGGHGASILDLVSRRDELSATTRALCLGDRDGLCLALQATGIADIVVIDPEAFLVDYYARHGVRAMLGDLRFITGFPFGAFDLVTSYGGEHDESILNTVISNLKPYAAFYTSFAASYHERAALIELFSRLETELIITDMLEQDGVFSLRAVKYPELRGNPEFLRYYID